MYFDSEVVYNVSWTAYDEERINSHTRLILQVREHFEILLVVSCSVNPYFAHSFIRYAIHTNTRSRPCKCLQQMIVQEARGTGTL